MAAPCAVRAQQSGTYEQASHAVHALHTSPISANAPLPTVTYSADQQTGAVGEGSFALQGHVHIIGGKEFEARADSLAVNQSTGIYSATGNVLLHEIDTTLTGQRFTFNRKTQQGELIDSLFNYPPFYVATPSILLSPQQITATDATITTSPPGKRPEFHIAASDVTINPAAQRVYFRNAKLYVYGTRLVTLKRYSQRTTPNPNENAVNQPLRPSFGYDSHRGPYLVIDRNLGSESIPINAEILAPAKRDPSASLSTSTIILLNKNANHPVTQVSGQPISNPNDPVALARNFASFPGRPLPDGDPLLYHDFLGNDPLESVLNAPVTPDLSPSATLSYRQPLYGRRIGDLSYSKLPEGELSLNLPLYGEGRLPSNRNPEDVRRALRTLYLFARANVSTGYYMEQPTQVKSDRTAGSFTLDTRPLLIGQDLLFRPSVRFYEAQYVVSHTHYGYEQFNFALQRSYTERNAIGVQYIYTAQHGRDPFVFDSVDDTQELDLRGQTAFGRDIVGARIKFNMNRRDLYDYELDYSFPQNSYIPTITYDNLSHLVGLQFNISGVTF